MPRRWRHQIEDCLEFDILSRHNSPLKDIDLISDVISVFFCRRNDGVVLTTDTGAKTGDIGNIDIIAVVTDHTEVTNANLAPVNFFLAVVLVLSTIPAEVLNRNIEVSRACT